MGKKMNRKTYNLLLWCALTILVLGIIVAIFSSSPWNIFGGIVAGGATSLLTSTIIQLFASEEQTNLLRELTLTAEGIQPLPDGFRSLKWLAHTTQVITKDGKKNEWRCGNIEKVGDSRQKFVTYTVPTKNLVGEVVKYHFTFIGLTGCVVGIISLGDEKSSVFIFEAPVSAAGMYFGPGYITDWSGKRNLAIAIVGTDSIPDLKKEWPNTLKHTINEWKNTVNWGMEPLFSPFDQEVSKNTNENTIIDSSTSTSSKENNTNSKLENREV
jgi:hypothetical protein